MGNLADKANADPGLADALKPRADLDTPAGPIIGGRFALGRLTVAPPTLAHYAALRIAGSPFLTGGESVTVRDVAVAAYLLTQPEAMAALLSLDSRRRALDNAAATAEKSPVLAAAYFDAVQGLAGEEAAFTAAALAFWAEHGTPDLQTAADTLCSAVVAGLRPLQSIQRSAREETSPVPFAGNGSRGGSPSRPANSTSRHRPRLLHRWLSYLRVPWKSPARTVAT